MRNALRLLPRLDFFSDIFAASILFLFWVPWDAFSHAEAVVSDGWGTIRTGVGVALA
jgi:hypothetical protein